MMDFYPDRATVYAMALKELDGMAAKAVSVAFYAVDYEAAIVNVSIIFETPVDLVITDLNAYRAGRRSQGVAA